MVARQTRKLLKDFEISMTDIEICSRSPAKSIRDPAPYGGRSISREAKHLEADTNSPSRLPGIVPRN
jgi:hypothetical protein